MLDADARAAVDSLVESFKALEGGILYEDKPDSVPARELARLTRQTIDEYRRVEREQQTEPGAESTSDEDVKRALVFLARVAVTRDNQRPRGRAFMHFVTRQFPAGPTAPEEPSPIIAPG